MKGWEMRRVQIALEAHNELRHFFLIFALNKLKRELSVIIEKYFIIIIVHNSTAPPEKWARINCNLSHPQTHFFLQLIATLITGIHQHVFVFMTQRKQEIKSVGGNKNSQTTIRQGKEITNNNRKLENVKVINLALIKFWKKTVRLPLINVSEHTASCQRRHYMRSGNIIRSLSAVWNCSTINFFFAFNFLHTTHISIVLNDFPDVHIRIELYLKIIWKSTQ